VTRAKLWLFNGLMVLVSLPIALVLAELCVRLLAPQPTGLTNQDRYGLPMLYPGITRNLPQFGGHDVSINRAGLRDREHTNEKPADVFRILLLGDSFMEALQVPFDSALASRLERALPATKGKRVEVINGGISGWGTDDQLRYLTRYGLTYQPDLIVVAMTLHNDIADNLRQSWHTVQNGTLIEKPVVPISKWNYRKLRLKAYIATRFQLYQLWRRVQHGGEIRRAGAALNTHVLDLFRDSTPGDIARGFDLTNRLLSALQDTARVSGSKVALVLLPIRYQLADSTFAQFARAAEVPDSALQLDKPQRAMGEIATRLQIPVIDLLPVFRQRMAESDASLYVEWDGHWNSAGHRLAAEAVAEGLLRTGVLQ
jgi:hypothetical protein